MDRPTHKLALMRRLLVAVALCSAATQALSGNCLVQGGKKIGECDNVNVRVGPAEPLDVKKSGSFPGSYGRVVVHPGATAWISGSTDDVLVLPRATAHISGSSDNVRVEGVAFISGAVDRVYVENGGSATISGIADGVSGPGRVVKAPGAIIEGVYITDPPRRRAP